jgi:hypothetical protein
MSPKILPGRAEPRVALQQMRSKYRAASGGGGSCLSCSPVLTCVCSRSLPFAESRIWQRRIIPEDNLRLIIMSSWIATKRPGRRTI